MNSFRKAAWLLAALAIVSAPAHIAHANGASGNIAIGDTKTGTIIAAGHDDYTFSGAAGRAARLAVSATGGEGFQPLARIIGPSGTEVGWLYCDTSCSADFALPDNGNYTLVVGGNDGREAAGSYSVSVNNAP